jgi:hypothetical protein
VNATLTFLAGQTSTSIIITSRGDEIAEIDEDFVVRLSTPTSGLMIGEVRSATIVISDDDCEV